MANTGRYKWPKRMAGHLGNETVNFTHGLIEKLLKVDRSRACRVEAAILPALFPTTVGTCSVSAVPLS